MKLGEWKQLCQVHISTLRAVWPQETTDKSASMTILFQYHKKSSISTTDWSISICDYSVSKSTIFMYLGASTFCQYCPCQFLTQTYCVSIVWVLTHTTDAIIVSTRKLHLYNADAQAEIPSQFGALPHKLKSTADQHCLQYVAIEAQINALKRSWMPNISISMSGGRNSYFGLCCHSHLNCLKLFRLKQKMADIMDG